MDEGQLRKVAGQARQAQDREIKRDIHDEQIRRKKAETKCEDAILGDMLRNDGLMDGDKLFHSRTIFVDHIPGHGGDWDRVRTAQKMIQDGVIVRTPGIDHDLMDDSTLTHWTCR